MKKSSRHWILTAMAGIALGAIAWAGLAPVSAEMREAVHVIPKGTWARRAAGEKLDTMPAEIHLTLGVKDVLVMENQDDVPQMFGPVLIMPGQSFRLPFGVASRYDFACTAHVNGSMTIFVAPAPAWWERLILRADAIMRPFRST